MTFESGEAEAAKKRPWASLLAKIAGWTGLVLFAAMSGILLLSGEIDAISMLRLAALGSLVVPLALKAIRGR